MGLNRPIAHFSSSNQILTTWLHHLCQTGRFLLMHDYDSFVLTGSLIYSTATYLIRIEYTQWEPRSLHFHQRTIVPWRKWLCAMSCVRFYIGLWYSICLARFVMLLSGASSSCLYCTGPGGKHQTCFWFLYLSMNCQAFSGDKTLLEG